MEKYDPAKIEKKWQARWESLGLHAARGDSAKKKFYLLDMFPYPSGDGLHVGHVEGYTATDVVARYLRMRGFDVLHPMGWDAFGLPAENYAIKTKVHPRETTERAIETFRRQIRSLGLSYDWSREIGTHTPEYYRFTQWLFLQLYKNGLAYRKLAKANWCESCKTVLANEQVEDGRCERCKGEVVQKELEQWFFKITDFAEDLVRDLDTVDWPASTVANQRNWIGRSEGAEIDFPIVFDSRNGKKPNYLVLHGYTGRADRNFLPWIAKELESRGFEVQVPELPNTERPTEEEQVSHVLKNCRIDEKTIIVGHSLGAIVAMKVVEKRKKPVGGLVLVASAMDPVSQRPEKRFFHTTFSWDVDFALLKKLAPYRVVLSDLREKKRISYLEKQAEGLGARLLSVAAEEEHFTAEEEPAVLAAVLPRIAVFTTRPDTLFGATYLVLAPEHPLVGTLAEAASNRKEALDYVEMSKRKTELERTTGEKEKTGVELGGVKAVNPATKEEIPVWIADYVLPHYGTGAIMAVPAHDERDFAFARRFKLPVRQVVMPAVTDPANPPRSGKENTKREIVHCIVLHPTEKKFIALKHKTQPWLTPVTGGIEGGESVVDGALREIKEETGYRHPVFLEELPYVINAKFFAAHKDVNRDVVAHILKFKLKDLAHAELSAEEKAKHEVVWLPLTELHTLHPVSELDHIVSWFRSGATAYTGKGILTNSGAFSGLESDEAKKKIVEAVGGRWMVTYRLRDWLVSRQRYWGAPIPIIYCEACGAVPVPEEDLPVLLPDDVDFMPTGESPLARSPSFQDVSCPSCGGKARRESDTMDTFVCSSWYYLRFADPHNEKEFASREALRRWLPVDLYVGGAEHTVLHLMYARFFTKALHKLGRLSFREPFLALRHQGLILAEDGRKMSKSLGNVINPDDIVAKYGADTLRLYEMFMGPLSDAKPWNTKSIAGPRRFLEGVWRLAGRVAKREPEREELRAVHRAVKKVGEDIEAMKLNTAASALMILVGELERRPTVAAAAFDTLLAILFPFAPHLAEELWERRGRATPLAEEPWPAYDPAALSGSAVTIAVQVNGKARGAVEVSEGAGREEVARAAAELPAVATRLLGRRPARVVFVPGRLINFVLPADA